MKGLRNDVSRYGSLETGSESNAFMALTHPRPSSASCLNHLSSSAPVNAATVITIEEDNDERTPLLKQHNCRAQPAVGNSHHDPEATSYSDASTIGYQSSSSFTSQRSILPPESQYSEGSSSYTTSNFSYNTVESIQAPKMEVCDFRLIVFMSFLIAGMVLASYLMLTETRLPTLGFSLDLVSRDIWSKMSLEGLLNHSIVQNVLIMQTRGENCPDADSCIDVLKNMQNSKEREGNYSFTEIPYNFLIGSDGQTYEVRGWDYESGFKSLPQNNTLVIGFMGDYNNNALSQAQQNSAHSLIRESVIRKKLQQDYDVYSLHNITISPVDGEEISQVVSKWPRFKNKIHVT